MNKIPYLFTALSIVLTTPVFATDFIMLGDNPSMIIKFKNKTSSFTQKNVSHEIKELIHAPGISFTKTMPMSQGAYVVYFKNEALADDKLAQESGLKEVSKGCYTQESIQQFIQILEQNPDVEYVSPNSILTGLGQENSAQDQELVNANISAVQWNLLAPPGGLNIKDAWAITQGNSNAIVAVLDSGVLNNVSLNPSLLPGVHFVGSNIGPGASPSCPQGCGNDLHGTHVNRISKSSNGI